MAWCLHTDSTKVYTANLGTKILNFRWFDSSKILISRAVILTSTRNFPEVMSQAILAGIILEGRLGMLALHRDAGTQLGACRD